MAEQEKTPAVRKRGWKEHSDFLAGCTTDERAYAVRLVRLLRTNYWFSHFMLHMLRLEADSPFQVTFRKVRDQLRYLEGVEDLLERVKYVSQRSTNYFYDHPAFKAVRDEWGGDAELAAYKNESEIRQLVTSAQDAAAKKKATDKAVARAAAIASAKARAEAENE
jgi:hypothetical protein